MPLRGLYSCTGNLYSRLYNFQPPEENIMASVETPEYLKAAARFIRAAGRRVANADEADLAQLLTLQNELDAAVQTAVDGIRSRGHSWAYIAAATGTTRSAAFQRWGGKSN
jgi:hypothetical protein